VGVVWAAMRVEKVRLRRWCKRQAVFGCVGAVVSDSRVLAAGVDWRASVANFTLVTVKGHSLRVRWLRWLRGRVVVVLAVRRSCRCG
jgi:hypothetical protein